MHPQQPLFPPFGLSGLPCPCPGGGPLCGPGIL